MTDFTASTDGMAEPRCIKAKNSAQILCLNSAVADGDCFQYDPDTACTGARRQQSASPLDDARRVITWQATD